MKRASTLLITLGIIITCRAQYHPLISEENTWAGITYGWGEFDFYQSMQGDSIIGEFVYAKVFSGNTIDAMNYQIALIREDVVEQTVYMRLGEVDHLLYDFDVEVDDVVTAWGISGDLMVTITAVESVVVNGTNRDKIIFEDAWGPAYWIEGVGSMYGLTDAVIGGVTDYGPNLMCFYEGTTLAWSNPTNVDPCEDITAVVEQNISPILIWPNPISDHMSITINQSVSRGLYDLKIFSVLGDVVYARRMSADAMKQIAVPDLSQGVYHLSLFLNDRIVASGTVFKE